jgi:glucuronate isomerase
MGVADLEAYAVWLGRLEAVANVAISSYSQLLDALERRHAFFHQVGCRLSDRGLDIVPDIHCTPERARTLFEKARAKKPLSLEEQDALRWRLLHDLAVMDHGRGWVMQLHIGALRNVAGTVRAQAANFSQSLASPVQYCSGMPCARMARHL